MSWQFALLLLGRLECRNVIREMRPHTAASSRESVRCKEGSTAYLKMLAGGTSSSLKSWKQDNKIILKVLIGFKLFRIRRASFVMATARFLLERSKEHRWWISITEERIIPAKIIRLKNGSISTSDLEEKCLLCNDVSPIWENCPNI